MLQFTLGGLTNEDLDIAMMESPIILLPRTEERRTTIPGKIGEVVGDSDYQGMTFILNCEFTGAQSKSALRAQTRTLTDHLTDAGGQPRDIGLTFPDEPNLTYTVRYAGRGLEAEKVLGGKRGKFELRLFAPDPRATGPEETVTATITGSVPQSLSIENDGNVLTPLVITITNNGSNVINQFEIYKIEE